MKPDIREKTVLVVKKNGYWLSRREMLTGQIIWDQHLSSAWTTRDRKKAEEVARITGGTVYLFNQIIWRTKVL